MNIATPGTYNADVNTIVNAGGTITEKFRTLTTRWEDFTNSEYAVQHELNDAILNGTHTPEELEHLRILAQAEAATNHVHVATVRNSAATEVLNALRTEYKTVAEANYNTIRKTFNTKATQLTTALNITDSEDNAESIVKASTKERAAWSDAPAYAYELTAMINTLHTAATLAGLTPTRGKLDQTLIGLTINAEGLHRRRVWEAWETTTGRAGNWRELWKLGATIEAPALNDAKPYNEPAAMENRGERRELGTYQWLHDPEDDIHNNRRERVQAGQLQQTASQAGIKQMDYEPETGVNVY